MIAWSHLWSTYPIREGETVTARTIRELADLPPIFTVSELRDVLRISLPKAYELAHQQEFPKVYVGRVIRIPRDSFISWLARNGDSGHEPEAVSSSKRDEAHVG
jgi:excisionase family DNA binding protein